MAAEPIGFHNTATKAQQPSGVRLRSAKPPRPLCVFTITHQDLFTPIMLLSLLIRSSKEQKKKGQDFFLLRHVGKSVFIRWEVCACAWALINSNDSIVFFSRWPQAFGFYGLTLWVGTMSRPPPATNGHFYSYWSADYFQEKSIKSVKYQQSETQRS